MSANTEMVLVEGHSWRRGLRPMMRRESRKWWASKRWFVQSILWVAILDGILASALFLLPKLVTPDGQPLIPDDPFALATNMFFGMGILGTAIGAIVLLQDVILGERESGTAEWVLSKPISRGAYVLAKLLPNLALMLITMIALPGAVGYVLFRLYDPSLIELGAFLQAEGVVTLHLAFYISLTLMLGAAAKSRSVLLGVAFASLLGGNMVPIVEIVQFTPWSLGQIAMVPILGIPLGSLGVTMLASTAVWSILFVAVAVWKFQRIEF